MGEGGYLVIFIVLQRLAELMIAKRNTARLLAAGGVEFGRGHYPLMVLFHVVWIAGLWILGKDHDVNRIGLAIFIVLQLLRVWTIATLGPRWTTRIVVMPGLPRVTGGPYRFIRHPNYAIVGPRSLWCRWRWGCPFLRWPRSSRMPQSWPFVSRPKMRL